MYQIFLAMNVYTLRSNIEFITKHEASNLYADSVPMEKQADKHR